MEKKKGKRIGALLLSLAMFVTQLQIPVTAYGTEAGSESVEVSANGVTASETQMDFVVTDENGSPCVAARDYNYDLETGVLTIMTAAQVKISMKPGVTTTSDRIVVISDGYQITLSNVTIETDLGYAFESKNNGQLTLEGKNTLASDYNNCAGLYVSEPYMSLIINGTGSLSAQGKKNAAGIAGHMDSHLYIEGGNIKAVGNSENGIRDIHVVINKKNGNMHSGTGVLTMNGIGSSIELRGGGGVVFDTNTGTGTVYGNPTILTDWEIPAGMNLTIKRGETLTLGAGTTLTNMGQLIIEEGGTLDCMNAAFYNKGSFTNNGTLVGAPAYDVTQSSLIIDTSGDYKIVGKNTETVNTITVRGADTVANITLEGVKIATPDADGADAAFQIIEGATVNLTLSGTNSLKSNRYKNPGLQVEEGNTLVITAASGENTLEAVGRGGAGIGGSQTGAGGTITISGGKVTANSLNGAGIGGGQSGTGGTIEIRGGSVTASSGVSGAGIGSGAHEAGGTIKIYGGSITASSGLNGAGIGGGYQGNGGTIEIHGGSVTASSNGNGFGIGAGFAGDAATTTVTITGGSVKASASSAAISPAPIKETSTPVYLAVISNPANAAVTIDGASYLPTQHMVADHTGGVLQDAPEDCIYVYLTGEDHKFTLGDKNYVLLWNGTDFEQKNVYSFSGTKRPGFVSAKSGTTLGSLKIDSTGVLVKKNDGTTVSGTWQLAAEENRTVCPAANGTTSYTLEFVPAEASADYVSLTCEAVPVIITTDTPEKPEAPVVENPASPQSAMTVNAPLKVTAKKDSVKLVWEKVEGADGYIIYGALCYGKNKKFKTISDGDKNQCTLKKLQKATAYKFHVRAYKLVDGKKVYISKTWGIHVITAGSDTYTNVKKVKAKTNHLALTVGKSKTIKASVEKADKNKSLLNHTKKLRYISSDEAVATVGKSGKVKAVGTGTCDIYVVAENGVYKKIKVTVEY